MDVRVVLCFLSVGCAVVHTAVSADLKFTCGNWDSYSDQYFADAAYAGIIGENGRKCRISKGSASTACNWYVKYDIDGDASDDWLGLTFGGVPGGTGCCASVSDCSTKTGAGAWLKLKHKEYCCGADLKFTCGNWESYTDQYFADAAYSGIIGENGRKCRITKGSTSTACNWYVKYDIDGDASDDWLGLTFGGVPGGTGCCASISDCSTKTGAGAWLKLKHKDYCCGGGASPTFHCQNWDTYSAAEFGAMATAGNIGAYGRKCRIRQGNSNTACNWYVSYDIDGDSSDDWQGLTWGGTPGGTGCCASISACSTLEGAGAWLKAMHKQICCGVLTKY